MAYGVSCLAMRADGIHFHNANAEIIRDGVDGFLAANDEEFGRILARLIAQPTALRKAGQAARDVIAASHTWDNHLDRYERLFAELRR